MNTRCDSYSLEIPEKMNFAAITSNHPDVKPPEPWILRVIPMPFRGDSRPVPQNPIRIRGRAMLNT